VSLAGCAAQAVDGWSGGLSFTSCPLAARCLVRSSGLVRVRLTARGLPTSLFSEAAHQRKIRSGATRWGTNNEMGEGLRLLANNAGGALLLALCVEGTHTTCAFEQRCSKSFCVYAAAANQRTSGWAGGRAVRSRFARASMSSVIRKRLSTSRYHSCYWSRCNVATSIRVAIDRPRDQSRISQSLRGSQRQEITLHQRTTLLLCSGIISCRC
jgi:hypothetical protein